VCTRKEIELALSAPHLDDGAQRYPGTCAGRFASADAARAQSGRVPAMRFRVSEGVVTWTDELLGAVVTDVFAEVGDFPVFGRDGFPAYQLAVVVDDAEAGVTHVVRGADLLGSTGRQIHLQHRLGYPTPSYAHLPVVVNAAGEKLSKQTLAAPVDAWPPAGALLAALAFLGQNPPAGLVRATPAEIFGWAVANWSLARVPRVRQAALPDAGPWSNDRTARPGKHPADTGMKT
jgi:glutamyl-Q tRNA(Asp) synthetase